MSNELIYRCRRAKIEPPLRRTVRRTQRILPLHEAPLAGFQYYRAEDVWPFLQEGETLRLVREGANPHDASAVAIWFRNEKLGYVPRTANGSLAYWIDRGQPFQARILRLKEVRDPWARVWVRLERTFG